MGAQDYVNPNAAADTMRNAAYQRWLSANMGWDNREGQQKAPSGQYWDSQSVPGNPVLRSSTTGDLMFGVDPATGQGISYKDALAKGYVGGASAAYGMAPEKFGLSDIARFASVAGPVLGGLGVFGDVAGASAGTAAGEGASAIAPWGAGEAVSGAYAPTATELGGASAANAGMDLGMYNPNQANPYVTGASGAGATAATNAAAGGAATGATVPAATGTALSRILAGAGTAEDYLSIGGAVAPSLLSAYGSKVQADKYGDLAGRYEGYGAPYRQNLADITNDPSKFYDSPAATKATDAILRRLSISGNPAGNPYSQALGVDALYKEYGAERDRQAGYGGLTQYNAATPQLAAGAIGAQGAVYSDLGYGLGNVLAPKKTLAQQLAEYKAAGGSI